MLVASLPRCARATAPRCASCGKGTTVAPRRAPLSRSAAGRATLAVRCAAAPGRAGQPLTSWLLAREREGVCDTELVLLITAIATACRRISSLVARAPIDGMTGLAATAANASGDAQKKLDVLSNDVFVDSVRSCGKCSVLVSEEEADPVALAGTGGYITAFDPIDGSSNIDAAVPTGSIFGIYSQGECVVGDDDTPEEVLRKCALNVRKAGTELAAAGYCMYSSSTVLVLTLGAGVAGFTLDTNMGEFVLSHPDLRLPDGNHQAAGGCAPHQRIFSGNAGNVALWAPPLRQYMEQELIATQKWAFRYIGALVGDFHRTLLYGGIWLYPPDAKAPSGKARLLYEVAPMAMLAEQAGGLAVWGERAEKRVLDVVPQSPHQKSPLFVGTASEVRRLQAFLQAHKA